MSNQQHPLTPPPELLQKWIDEPQYLSEDWLGKRMNMVSMNEVKFKEIINKASQYGADQELEATLGLMATLNIRGVDYVRNARRPKPPSLKEQALAELESIMTELHESTGSAFVATFIPRALEALDD